MKEQKKKILIIDDDETLSFLTAEMLRNYGYEVTEAADADAAFDLLRTQSVHLILLDINLTGLSGFEICEELRRVSRVPVIFASARTREEDKIKGLDIGGDDYLEKPYSLKELLARVNALIRRTYGDGSEKEEYQFGNVHVDALKRIVTKNGAEVRLSLKEFDVLCFLCKNRGKAVRKEEILSGVWGTFSEAELSTVSVHIRWLREKIEDDPSKPCYIRTVWGVGYQLPLEGEES